MTKTCTVAFKAHLGWLNVAVCADGTREPSPIVVARVDLFEGASRDITEPYHVAGGWEGLSRVPKPENPEAVIERGRRAQADAAVAVLRGFRRQLAALGWRWRHGIVLTGKGRLVTDLEKALSSHAQIHVMEGEAIRDAARTALKRMRIKSSDVPEHGVLGRAEAALRADDADAWMKSRRPEVSGKWGKEERLLALAAWLG